jgi:ketosteroid isomerase-like protein
MDSPTRAARVRERVLTVAVENQPRDSSSQMWSAGGRRDRGGEQQLVVHWAASSTSRRSTVHPRTARSGAGTEPIVEPFDKVSSPAFSSATLALSSGERRAMAATSASRRREASSPALTIRTRRSGRENARWSAFTASERDLPLCLGGTTTVVRCMSARASACHGVSGCPTATENARRSERRRATSDIGHEPSRPPGRRDTGRAMSEESTSPDPAQQVRDAFAAATAEDLDGVTAGLAPNAVWEMDEVGLGPFEGVSAIRAFLLEWWSLWDEHNHHVEDVYFLNERVGYAIVREDGRTKGSERVVEARVAHVLESVDGLVVRDITYTDIAEARAAAERLAEERG